MRFNSLMEPSSACSYVATQRGGVALLFEGHRYNKVRDGKDGTVYWRCSRDRQCPGRAVTVNNRVKKSNNKHNHPPEASLMLRNGSGSLASTSSHSHSSSNATSRYSGTSDSSTMMAAAAAYASFLHGSNSVSDSGPGNPIKHSNSSNNKSSQLANNNSISITPQSRIPSAHHNSPLPSSPMELSATNSNNNNNNNGSNDSNFQSAFSFLQNLASNNYSNNSASHLLANNPLLANHHSNEYGRPSAMNLSSSSSSNSNNLDSQSANLYSLSNHFNMIHHHRNALESSFKMAARNSRPPTPPPTSHLNLNSKTLHHQYSKMFKSKHYPSNKSTNSPFDSTFDPQTFNRRVTTNTNLQIPTNSPTPPNSSLDIVGQTMANIKSNNSPAPTPPSSASSLFGMNQSQNNNNTNNFSNENTTGYQDHLASAMLQDVFQEAQAAAVAAAAFPSLLNETFKFLSATAATNPQMAAALASTLSNQNLLKNFDLNMATATAAAVVAASNNNSNNSNNNGNQSSRSVSEKLPSIDDLINHSSFASLGTSFPSDLVNSSPFYQEDQPLNMALKDKSNILKLLRSLMRAGTGMQQHYNNDLVVPAVESFHALVIPTADAHGSEYIAPCDARRTFLTNFTGSAGTAVVTMNEAALWTDGRYFLQAARELDEQNWILMKQFQPETPSIGEWLNKVLPHGSKIGVDPFTLSYSGWTKLQEELLLCGNQLVQTPINLIDQIWTWRPARSSEAVFPLDIKFAGKSWNDKLIEIRQEMAKKDASLLVLTALDDIAWLFNLRGSDIEYNPVFFSYAAVTQNRAYLFIDECKLTTQTLKHLGINESVNVLNDSKSSSSSTRSTPSATSTNGGPPLSPESVKNNENNNNPDATNSGNVIEIRPYETIVEFLRSYISLKFNDKIWISNKSSYALVSLIPESRRILTGVSPVCCRKAIKNPVELDGMRRAHIKDAVALCELFAWIEDEVVNKKKSTTMDTTTTVDPLSPNSSSTSSSSSGQYSIVDELNVDLKLDELRRKQKEYVGPSFATIAGSGPNSAVIHYKSSEATNRPITTEEMFLLDCGAQYRDGTTDVTRTIHLGTPSNYEKECFTRVVKGHISLAQARFPRLTKGQFLDAYARRALWDVGLDYNHGTGHGVGMFLNVHEPPIGIANRINMDDPGLDENMILSNEPGFYEPNKFGIRIESLVITKKDNLKYNFNERGYLGFETITLLPIQTKLLDLSLLTNDEIKWIDDFHQQCREIIGSELEKQGQQRALQWLLNETNPIMK